MNYFTYRHKPIHFEFRQSVDRFYVREVPLHNFTNSGSYLILKVEKQDMSTSKLITVIASSANCNTNEIGYAGLKDKSATTIQYISLPKKYEKDLLKNLTTPRVKILETKYHKSPIKIGELKGNNFIIKLHNISPNGVKEFENVAKIISKEGIANYYGYQRFGEDGRSYLKGKEIAHSGKRLKGDREKLLVASYQSYLFNRWLSYRVKISSIVSTNSPQKASKLLNFPIELIKELKKQPQFFKLFLGDLLMSYPYGKTFYLNNLSKSSKSFKAQELSPTGLLAGDMARRAKSDARYLEEEFDDNELTSLKGDRRFAWIYPKAIDTKYNKKDRVLEVSFFLPKGSYATTLLEQIGNFSLKKDRDEQ